MRNGGRPVSAPCRPRGRGASGKFNDSIGPLKDLLCDQTEALKDAAEAFETYKSGSAEPLPGGHPSHNHHHPHHQHHQHQHNAIVNMNPRPPSAPSSKKKGLRSGGANDGWDAIDDLEPLTATPHQHPACLPHQHHQHHHQHQHAYHPTPRPLEAVAGDFHAYSSRAGGAGGVGVDGNGGGRNAVSVTSAIHSSLADVIREALEGALRPFQDVVLERLERIEEDVAKIGAPQAEESPAQAPASAPAPAPAPAAETAAATPSPATAAAVAVAEASGATTKEVVSIVNESVDPLRRDMHSYFTAIEKKQEEIVDRLERSGRSGGAAVAERTTSGGVGYLGEHSMHSKRDVSLFGSELGVERAEGGGAHLPDSPNSGPGQRGSFKSALRRASSAYMRRTSLDKPPQQDETSVQEMMRVMFQEGNEATRSNAKYQAPNSDGWMTNLSTIADSIFGFCSHMDSSKSFLSHLVQRCCSESMSEEVSLTMGKTAEDLCGAAALVVQEPEEEGDIGAVAEHLTREQLLASPAYDPEVDVMSSGSVPEYLSLFPILDDTATLVGVLKFMNRISKAPGDVPVCEPNLVGEIDGKTFTATLPIQAERREDYHFTPLMDEDYEWVSIMLTFASPILGTILTKEKSEADRSLLAQIVEVVNVMGRVPDMNSLITHASEGAKKLVESEICNFYTLKEDDPTTYILNGKRKVSTHDTSHLLESVLKRKETVMVTLTHRRGRHGTPTGDTPRTPRGEPVPAASIRGPTLEVNPGYAKVLNTPEIRDIMATPITFEGKIFGVIEMVNKKHGTYSRFDSLLVESLGNYAGITMQHHYAMKAMDTASKKANAMVDVCRSLASVTLDHHALHLCVMEHARDIVNADRASLFIVDHQKKQLSAQFGNQEVRMPISKGIAGTVATTGYSLNITDCYSDQRFNKSVDMKSGYRTDTLLAVPVKCDGVVVAVAQLINKKQVDGKIVPFDAEDEALLATFSNFAGISLRISGQYQDLSKERGKFKTMLEAVVGVADFDIREGVNNLCRTIMHQAKQLLLADRCTLFMIDKENSQLYSVLTDAAGGEIRFGMHQGIAGQAVRLGVTLNIADAYKDKNFNTETDRKSGYRTKSILAAPVKCEGDVIAVMQLINKAGDMSFDDEDQTTLSYFATLAGICIRNSQLFEFATKGSEELSNVLLKMNKTANKPNVAGDGSPSASPRELELRGQVAAALSSMSEEEMDSSQLPTFDIHHYRNKKDGLASALAIVHRMFHSRGMAAAYNLDADVLRNFLVRVALGYRNVPYHNVFHAIDVTQTLFRYMHLLPGCLTMLEEFVLLLCGMCHDVDHMGLNNSFHYKAETPLGILNSATGGSSPLEIHHCNYSIEILQTPEYNIFLSFPNHGDEISVYKLLVKCILGTDMAHHGRILGEMPDMEQIVDPLPEDVAEQTADRSQHLIVLLKAADISNVTKPFEISRAWAYCVIDEFYMQGDQEARKIGEISNEMFDRNSKKEVAEGQLGFINFVCLKFYESLIRVFPALSPLMDQLVENKKIWTEIHARDKAEAEAALEVVRLEVTNMEDAEADAEAEAE